MYTPEKENESKYVTITLKHGQSIEKPLDVHATQPIILSLKSTPNDEPYDDGKLLNGRISTIINKTSYKWFPKDNINKT